MRRCLLEVKKVTTPAEFDYIQDTIHHLTAPKKYGQHYDKTDIEFLNFLLGELEQKNINLGADNVAAFFAEPIMGRAGGVIVPPHSYHQKTWELCKKYDVYMFLMKWLPHLAVLVTGLRLKMYLNKFYLDGQWLDNTNGNTLDVISPATEDVVAQVACGVDSSYPEKIPDEIETHISNIINNDCATLTLGGDHFITYPILKAYAKKYGKGLSLIHFDAHYDTWNDRAEK